MGDRRFAEPYLRVKGAADAREEIRHLADEDVVAALAAAAAAGDPLATNVLATEAQNRVNLYATILATMGEGVFAVGSSGRLTAMNPAAQHILGWTFDELRGADMDAVLSCTVTGRGGTWQRRDVCAETFALKDTRREEEALFTRRDGMRFPVAYTSAPIRREGEVQGAVVVFRDISARRESEQKARRLAAIVEASDDAILSLAVDGTILTWNPRAEALYGYSAAEAVGKHATLVVPKELQADFETLLARVKNGEELHHHATKRLRRGGEVLDIYLTASPIRDGEGRVVALSWIGRDVTAARRHEQEIRASEERYRLLLDSATDHAIFLLDPEGRVMTWNPAAERIKGWKEEEIVGKHYSVLFPPEELAQGDPWTELEDARRDGRHEGEERRMRKDGTLFDASVVLSAMRDPNGELVGFVKVTRDVSERKAWERRIRTSEQRSRDLFAMFTAPALWCEPDGDIVTVNDAAAQALGFQPRELVGRVLRSLADTSDRPRIDRAVAAVKAGGARELRFALAGRNGDRLEMTWRLMPVIVDDVTTDFFAVADGEAQKMHAEAQRSTSA